MSESERERGRKRERERERDRDMQIALCRLTRQKKQCRLLTITLWTNITRRHHQETKATYI